MTPDEKTEVLEHGNVSLARWLSVGSDARVAVRQLLIREAKAGDRDLIQARKHADAGETRRLDELVNAYRAALAVIDDATAALTSVPTKR